MNLLLSSVFICCSVPPAQQLRYTRVSSSSQAYQGSSSTARTIRDYGSRGKPNGIPDHILYGDDDSDASTADNGNQGIDVLKPSSGGSRSGFHSIKDFKEAQMKHAAQHDQSRNTGTAADEPETSMGRCAGSTAYTVSAEAIAHRRKQSTGSSLSVEGVQNYLRTVLHVEGADFREMPCFERKEPILLSQSPASRRASKQQQEELHRRGSLGQSVHTAVGRATISAKPRIRQGAQAEGQAASGARWFHGQAPVEQHTEPEPALTNPTSWFSSVVGSGETQVPEADSTVSSGQSGWFGGNVTAPKKKAASGNWFSDAAVPRLELANMSKEPVKPTSIIPTSWATPRATDTVLGSTTSTAPPDPKGKLRSYIKAQARQEAHTEKPVDGGWFGGSQAAVEPTKKWFTGQVLDKPPLTVQRASATACDGEISSQVTTEFFIPSDVDSTELLSDTRVALKLHKAIKWLEERTVQPGLWIKTGSKAQTQDMA